jgi:hypothetical protein
MRGLKAVGLKSTTSLDGLSGPSCRTRSGIQEFRTPYALDSGFRRNDKSLRDKESLFSSEGEGFPPSPVGTLKAFIFRMVIS